MLTIEVLSLSLPRRGGLLCSVLSVGQYYSNDGMSLTTEKFIHIIVDAVLSGLPTPHFEALPVPIQNSCSLVPDPVPSPSLPCPSASGAKVNSNVSKSKVETKVSKKKFKNTYRFRPVPTFQHKVGATRQLEVPDPLSTISESISLPAFSTLKPTAVKSSIAYDPLLPSPAFSTSKPAVEESSIDSSPPLPPLADAVPNLGEYLAWLENPSHYDQRDSRTQPEDGL